jgi:hypothetical protein
MYMSNSARHDVRHINQYLLSFSATSSSPNAPQAQQQRILFDSNGRGGLCEVNGGIYAAQVSWLELVLSQQVSPPDIEAAGAPVGLQAQDLVLEGVSRERIHFGGTAADAGSTLCTHRIIRLGKGVGGYGGACRSAIHISKQVVSP